MKNQLITFPTIAGPIKGTCHSKVQLSAKFQIWAKNVCGVTDTQSLAYLVCDKPKKWHNYFKDEIVMLREAAECERRILRHNIPADFGHAVPSGQLCFCVIEI